MTSVNRQARHPSGEISKKAHEIIYALRGVGRTPSIVCDWALADVG